VATVTDALTTATASTTDASSYTSGSFTPGAGNLLVAFVCVTGATGSAPSLTDSQSIGWTQITSAIKASSADTAYVFIANRTAAASSMTVTFNTSGGATATGCIIFVAQVASMTRAGQDAVRQSAIQSNQAASGTPTSTFGAAVLTGNPTLGAVFNATNPATMTPPTSWTEQQDVGYATPTTGGEYVSRDSGSTSTTITWGGTSASAFCSLSVELDTSARPPDPWIFNDLPDRKIEKVEVVAY
jgi:hypothetical protein